MSLHLKWFKVYFYTTPIHSLQMVAAWQWVRMSNSHWDHFFLHDAFGVIISIINFFPGGKVCLVVASGAGGGACAPFASPPLGSGTASIHGTLGILRSEFLGATYALWSLGGGGGYVPLLSPPPLGPALLLYMEH